MSLSIRSLVATALATGVLAGAATLPAAAHDHGRHHPRPAGVEITAVQYNSPGFDFRDNRSLNGEWFTVRNSGRDDVRLRGFSVSDRDGHRYTFGRQTLRRGATVMVHTGFGRDDSRQAYQDSSRHLYDNVRGTLSLRDDAGRPLGQCSWNRWDYGRTSC